MKSKNRLIHILCSMMIGVLLVVLMMAALILSGILSAKHTNITIITQGNEALYDGFPLTNHNWSLTGGELKDGHTITVTVTGTQTSVGESENTVDVTIVDELGADVTGDYDINYELGILKVNPRVIVITSASAKKVYDGTFLKNDGFSVSAEPHGLVYGHKAVVNVTGKIASVGETPNTVEYVVIYDENDADVTSNYRLYIREGTLEVVSNKAAEDMPIFDGESNLLAGEGREDTVLYSVYSSFEDTVYLKISSYGDYTGNAWKAAKAYDKQIDDKYSASYLTSLALKEANTPFFTIKIISNYQPYALPYFLSTVGSVDVVQLNDVVCHGRVDDVYTVSYYRYKGGLSLADSKYSEFEKEYRSFVYSQYLEIDAETLEFMQGIIAEQNFSIEDPNVINNVATYIMNSAIYNKEYDRALDRESNIAVAFLSQYKEGVCRHYASAATLLYRALGIPARYTIGAVANLEANQWTSVTADKAHAWVEVYIDGLGWINVETTGSSGDGSSSASGGGSGGGSGGASGGGSSGAAEGGSPSGESNRKVELYPVTVRKKYDGEPIYAQNKLVGFEKYEQIGYTYSVEVVGERTELGITKSVVKNLIIYNELGEDVTSTFLIKLYTGKVQVYTEILYFESDSNTVFYDGKPFEPGKMTGGNLLDGHRYTVTSNASSRVGLQINSFNVTVLDEKNKDVTDIYYISKRYGTVNVLPLEITVKAGSANKTYDGTPLTCNEYSLSQGTLLEGHRIVFPVIVGSQTEIGRSENAIEHLLIYDELGKDVTANYIIKFKSGYLKVTP